VAIGLGFYSILFLAFTVLHSQQIVGPWHLRLDWLGILGYLSALTFWYFILLKRG